MLRWPEAPWSGAPRPVPCSDGSPHPPHRRPRRPRRDDAGGLHGTAGQRAGASGSAADDAERPECDHLQGRTRVAAAQDRGASGYAAASAERTAPAGGKRRAASSRLAGHSRSRPSRTGGRAVPRKDRRRPGYGDPGSRRRGVRPPAPGGGRGGGGGRRPGPRGGVGPGGVGNYLITAHRTSSTAPFENLPSLRRGNRIVVRVGAVRHIYEVRRTRETSFRSLRSLAEQRAAVPGHPGMAPTRAYLTLSTCATPEDHAAGNYWADRFHNPEHRIDKVAVLVRTLGHASG